MFDVSEDGGLENNQTEAMHRLREALKLKYSTFKNINAHP